ncbi:sugar nucleotide-binding protein [Halomicrobium sp. LC1Hm]|uniref:sugar nucleotide-binding protein n=1 Tax=Halomicrobium sp. LC1Hm TaxID=2610902 RepID=UPI00129825FF|nr:sugar nucleotide-binding protein [Halomicrobium sp. LC1Hm]
MDILITGASGFLGSRYRHLLEKDHNVAGTFYENPQRKLSQLDITHKDSVIKRIQELDPDIIVHTAAISDPDTCGRKPDMAAEINEEGTRNVAEAAKRVGAKLVYISTSFVFPANGTYATDSTPNPQTVYGQTKYNGEKIIQDELYDYIIIRCPKLFGTAKPENVNDITESILRALTEDGEAELDDTTERYPLFIDDVVLATQRLLNIDAQGIYHLSTHKPHTKYEFGKLVVDIFELEGDLIPIEESANVNRPSGIELDTTNSNSLGIKFQTVAGALNTIKHQRGCSFKTIYSFNPEELVEGESASKIRARLGQELGQDDDIEADMVVPVPESGIYPAMGYADEMGIPLYHGIIRDYETEKTLYEPNIEDRTRMLREKLVAVEDILEDERVVIIDEAVISGLTLSTVIDKCQTAGVSEIHVRIPSPPMRTQCSYGVLSEDADLVTDGASMCISELQKEIEDKYNLSSFRYLPIERFRQRVPTDYGFTCTECFEGNKQ